MTHAILAGLIVFGASDECPRIPGLRSAARLARDCAANQRQLDLLYQRLEATRVGMELRMERQRVLDAMIRARFPKPQPVVSD